MKQPGQTRQSGAILVVNAGSSSIKFAVFGSGDDPVHAGSVSEIGGASVLSLDGDRKPADAPDHVTAIELLLAALAKAGTRPENLAAAAHRVVHGGEALKAPAEITPRLIRQIESCIPLAPSHNPHNLAGILALAEAAPGLPQFASFDTSFHATNPDVAVKYALPDLPEIAGIRRYGFHGTSHRYVAHRA
ncbi:MAG: acetate kinase, partial [Paracoccaceae bacterium]